LNPTRMTHTTEEDLIEYGDRENPSSFMDYTDSKIMKNTVNF
jgi:hypothetical protein